MKTKIPKGWKVLFTNRRAAYPYVGLSVIKGIMNKEFADIGAVILAEKNFNDYYYIYKPVALEKFARKYNLKILKRLRKKINNESLKFNSYKEYFKRFTSLVKYAIIIRILDIVIVKELLKYFKQEDLPYILSSKEYSWSLKEELDLLSGKPLKEMVDSYAWISLGTFKEKPKTLKDYQKQLKQYSNKKEARDKILHEFKENLEKKRKILKNRSKKEKELVEKATIITLMKDDFRAKISQLIFKSKFKRYPLPFPRKKKYIFLTYNKKLINVPDIQEFERTYLNKEFKEKIEYKGRIACKGIAKGKARIVFSAKDFGKVKEKDILIVSNTTPDYVPILKKVKAIIAEEGGITAHVSLISREFGIPCVVGVESATLIFKDNDYVEVDAEKGIVRKLSK